MTVLPNPVIGPAEHENPALKSNPCSDIELRLVLHEFPLDAAISTKSTALCAASVEVDPTPEICDAN